MRQLQKLYPEVFIDEDIPMCCMIYFGYIHRPYTRSEIPEYQQANIHDSWGRILCPECIIRKIQSLENVK